MRRTKVSARVRILHQCAPHSEAVCYLKKSHDKGLVEGIGGYTWMAEVAWVCRQLCTNTLLAPLFGITLEGTTYVDVTLLFRLQNIQGCLFVADIRDHLDHVQARSPCARLRQRLGWVRGQLL